MQISLLQWNIWYKENPENIVKLLKELRPDVFCLQEMTINAADQIIKDVPAYIAKQLGYNYHHKELPIESTDGEPMMLANGIFSRYPITTKHFTWISQPQNAGGYDNEYRAYVEVELEIEGTHLSVGTTHMSYTHRFDITPNKKAEAGMLIKELEQHKELFVFAGDLNALPGSYTISKIEKLLQNVGPDYSEKTWTTKPFSYNGFVATNMNWRLDYAFATDDISVLTSRVVQTDYSDHLPIYLEIELT